MIPLRVQVDERRLSFSLTTVGLLAAVQLVIMYVGPSKQSWVEFFGLVPIRWWSQPTWEMLGPAQQVSALFTYSYVHADWFHCLSNLWWLYVFAPLVQTRFGTIATLMIYGCAGLAGGVVYVVMWPDSGSPLVGASASIAGLLGVYLVGCRDAHIRLLGFKSPVSARYFVPLFLLAQGLLAYLYVPSALGIAFGVHVIGCLVGAFVSMSYTINQTSEDTEITGRT